MSETPGTMDGLADWSKLDPSNLEVLNVLDITHDNFLQLKQDLAAAEREGSDPNAPWEDRVGLLLKDDAIVDWLKKGERDVILLDCQCEDKRMTALACSNLVSIIHSDWVPLNKNITRYQVLYHSCGRHTKSGDLMAGPEGLVKALLAQLVTEGNIRSTLPS
ncbi:hypothetical protein VTN77DRAFT_4687 [Rasamsonia byssochlamydoides]|uniref:uncharacterized protein n=1 Tax=Rasamsonia byssochlamydoides TaxID=89139 RepID=UPI003743A6E5